jgi:hypothetical protein
MEIEPPVPACSVNEKVPATVLAKVIFAPPPVAWVVSMVEFPASVMGTAPGTKAEAR